MTPRPWLALKAFLHVARAVVVGDRIFVSWLTRRDRLDVCSVCSHLRGSQCELCSCFVAVKSKLRTEACPKGFWN
jgi:hypothetical protein